MQVDPIKPTLKPPGTKQLKVKYEELLPSFALNFNFRRYIEEFSAGLAAALAEQAEGWGFTAAEMQTVFSLESFGGDGGDVDGDGAAIRQYTLHPNPKP